MRSAIVLLAAVAFSALTQPPAIDPAAATRAWAVTPLRSEPKVAWQVTPRYRDASAFALAEGVLVTGNTSGQGGTYAYDAASGKALWSVPGHIRGGPAIAGGFVYAVNDTRERYRFALKKLDLHTGKAAWAAVEEDLGNHDGPPVVIGGAIVVANRSGSISAFDPGTGAPLWRQAGIKVCVGQLSAADGLVYLSGGLTGSRDTLTALDAATGTTVWRAVIAGAGASGCGGGTAVADGLVITSIERAIIAYEARSGAPTWVRPVIATAGGRRPEVALSPLVVADGVVYTATTQTLVGVALVSGEQVFEMALPVTADPATLGLVAAGSVLYVHANAALPDGGRGAAQLYAIDLAERRLLWSHAVARIDQYDKAGSWPTRFMQPADGALFYENQQRLVKLVP